MKRLLLVTALASMSCHPEEDAVKDLRYYKDPRTGMCFGAGHLMVMAEHWNEVFTWVPCEKVPPELLQTLK